MFFTDFYAPEIHLKYPMNEAQSLGKKEEEFQQSEIQQFKNNGFYGLKEIFSGSTQEKALFGTTRSKQKHLFAYFLSFRRGDNQRKRFIREKTIP